MSSSCLQDAEQVPLGQTASPDAAASMVVAVTLGLGLAIALQASLERIAVPVSQKALHLFVIQWKVLVYTVTQLLFLGGCSPHHSCFIGKLWAATTEVAHTVYKRIFIFLFLCLHWYFCVNEGSDILLQVVWVGTTGRTALSCAPVEREASATLQQGSVSVPLVEWDSPANKVMLMSLIVSSCWGALVYKLTGRN